MNEPKIEAMLKQMKSIALLAVMAILYACSEQAEIVPIDNEEVAVIKQEEKKVENTTSQSLHFTIQGTQGFEVDQSISFKNQSRELESFQWDFGDGHTDISLNSTHAYSEAGKYTVTLTGKTADGKSLTASKDVYVRAAGAQLDLLYIAFEDSTLNFMELSTNTRTILYHVPYNPDGVLALDQDNRTVYYYDYYNNQIIENSLLEDNPILLFDDMPGVSDLEFDSSTGELFIALSYSDQILNYDTKNGTLNASFNSIRKGRFGKVKDMELKGGRIYTITPTQGFETVFGFDVDFGIVSQVINYEDGGYGYGVAFDDFNDKLYFNNVEETALMRADPDGSNIEEVINLDRFGTVGFTGLCLMGLEVVETRNLLIWSAWEDDAVHLMDLETSEEAVFQAAGLNGKFVPFENDGIL